MNLIRHYLIAISSARLTAAGTPTAYRRTDCACRYPLSDNDTPLTLPTQNSAAFGAAALALSQY
ncbi:hypothetical protein C1O30_20790 [Dickeya zeae]|nr:hypothetical protein C1O30_20790 [Dickeya zeae]